MEIGLVSLLLTLKILRTFFNELICCFCDNFEHVLLTQLCTSKAYFKRCKTSMMETFCKYGYRLSQKSSVIEVDKVLNIINNESQEGIDKQLNSYAMVKRPMI